MVKEIEKSILFVVHNMRFTANQLAICNILYNAPGSGLTLPQITSRMCKTKSGKIVSGTLSKLAQKIDGLEKPREKYGFTGYLLFFERFDGDLHKIRPEFRHIIDQHPDLKHAMQIPIEQIYVEFRNGLSLR